MRVLVLFASVAFAVAQTQDSISWGGRTRTWYLDTYGTSNGTSLVVDMHGLGGNALSIRGYSGFRQLAQSKGAVIAFPQGVSNSWNGGTCCGTAQALRIDDTGFLVAMVKKIMSENPGITKVYATGHSNGCMMSHRLAVEASDIFTGMGCMAFYLGVNVPNSYNPIPMIEIHGSNDRTVPYSGAEPNLQAIRSANGCSTSATNENLGDITIKSYLSGCTNNAPVALVTLPGVGHTPYSSSSGRSMAGHAWDFWERHT